MKLIDKIQRALDEEQLFYSFEFFPPKTAPGVENLYSRIERMGRLHPLFVDITWGAGGSTAGLSLEIASHVQNLTGIETMLHLTCTNMRRETLDEALQGARDKGLQNILALRGDPPLGADTWEACDEDFCHAVDLVRYIRRHHGDYFGVCVAGYPGGHPESESYRADLRYLREKVEAGADFVITQLFYDCDLFLRYVDDCRRNGIECPILPGLMPIHNYRSFQQVTRLVEDVPQEVLESIEPLRQDDAALREYGNGLLVEMCRRLMSEGVGGLHFYTLNLEQAVTAILGELGLIPEQVARALPWRSSASFKRRHEDVRPIFWANRPRSYHARTMDWDEFPNGRWGDFRSPAFGSLTDYHLTHHQLKKKERLDLWGESLDGFDDVKRVFVRFCRGEISALPWYDTALAAESIPLRDQLIRLNRNGFLTINSQPRANGVPSEDPALGWGGPGGRVFQKAYLELFVPEERLSLLLAAFEQYPSLTFHVVNRAGDSYSNCDTVNAVTWGVFPGQEIVQPTVVDPVSFMVWKDEAFALWTSVWGSIYPEESESCRLLERIRDSFYLVNVVDNDFAEGDLWAVFDQVVDAVAEGSAEAGVAAGG